MSSSLFLGFTLPFVQVASFILDEMKGLTDEEIFAVEPPYMAKDAMAVASFKEDVANCRELLDKFNTNGLSATEQDLIVCRVNSYYNTRYPSLPGPSPIPGLQLYGAYTHTSQETLDAVFGIWLKANPTFGISIPKKDTIQTVLNAYTLSPFRKVCGPKTAIDIRLILKD